MFLIKYKPINVLFKHVIAQPLQFALSIRMNVVSKTVNNYFKRIEQIQRVTQVKIKGKHRKIRFVVL